MPNHNINLDATPIVVTCKYISHGVILDSAENYELIEKLIVEEIPHEIKGSVIHINKPCYSVSCELLNPNIEKNYSGLDWEIKSYRIKSKDLNTLFLSRFNYDNYLNIINKI